MKLKQTARNNDLDPTDLDYAVKVLNCKKDRRLLEATLYEELIKVETNKLWSTAENIIKGEGFK